MSASADGGAATTVASSASYFPNGALKQFTYGNGIVHTLTQNARQLPSRSTDGTVLDLGTSFDANGNVAGVTDYTAAARQTKSMGYDGLDRLTSTTSPMFGTATYAYDTLDNLKQVTISSGSTPRNHYYCYHATSRRLDFVRSGPVCTGTASPAVTTLGYDLQGNLGNKNGTTYTFDYGNRLRSTAGLTYRYDAQGRRVRQDTANSQLKYSFYSGDGKLRWQRDEPAAKRLSHIYLGGSLVAELSRPIGAGTAAYTYQHTDALGSPIAKTNSAGTVIETSEYEPYGKLLNRANDDRPGYTGHVMDSASGLTYMQQRYYDPQIGRFLSVDPVTAYQTPTGAFNRYWYAANNPYRFIDPDGRQAKSGTPKQCGDQPCPEAPQPTTPPPVTPPPPPAVPSKTVATVTGKTQDEAAKAAQKKILGEQRKGQRENCGQVCPAPNGGFQVVITTNGATTACLPQVTCGGPDLHNHPTIEVTLTAADQALTNGQRPEGSRFAPSTTYSPHEAGYLIIGSSLYFRETPQSEIRKVK